MSKARQRHKSVRWARYFNRYASIPNVVIGGWSCVHAMNQGYPVGPWRWIRRYGVTR